MKNFKVLSEYKIIISLLVFSFLFHPGAFPLVSFNFVLADSCDELKPVLDKYYQASQEENIESYMSVMDVDYLRENLLDNYEDYVKSAWEVYDTKDYKFDIYNCKTEDSEALAYFNLSTTLLSDGQEVSTQRNYVALFSNVDGWKIRYVMDEDVFSQFQSGLQTQLFLDATKDEIIKTTDDAEAVVEYSKIEEELLASEFEDTISEGVEKREISSKEDGGGSIMFKLLLFISLSIIIFLFIKKKRG